MRPRSEFIDKERRPIGPKEAAAVSPARGTVARDSMRTILLVLAVSLLCAFTPGSPEYYVALAEKYVATGKPAVAFACLERAIALAPDRPDAYVSRAFLFLKQGDRHRAIADFSRVIELRPAAADIYLSRGFAHAEGGEPALAEADYRKACDID
ncbi:MAG TPA: tetratricopeptide repeat protein, partial [Geobacteraceae bacterium]